MFAFILVTPFLQAGSIATLDYQITGTALQVTPAVLSVPKGIAGSVLVSLMSGGSTNNAAVTQLASGAYVQAIIRGPGFPSPQRLVAAPNAPLLLPPINLVGNYELDNIALVDAATGQVRLEASPSTVPVNVFDQLLVSSVTSQPLSLAQIQQKGIAIDDSNFRAVEFNVSFVLDGQTIPVSFPVVSPVFSDSTELIPADEIQAKLKAAASINQQISSTMVSLPPQLQTAALNLQIQGINFQVTDPGGGKSLALAIPPIPALMVIPGNIGYLHQFFSVQIFTENGAPLGSGLSVDNVKATMQLPTGPDGILSTNYSQPGDDPVRFARIGPNKIIEPVQPVVDPGPDGQLGTIDDITRLQPGETGKGEFLVEGLQEGLQVLNISLAGDLYGLAAGVVHIEGKAAGSVLVRNPSFSLTFSHPNVVRVGEPYTASITVLNTSVTPANLVQVTLNKNSISGAALANGQPETIQFDTILPGQSATATYAMISERTGQIAFSDLTTGDDSVTGRFHFTMGVDAQGVPLSPDTIVMPDYVNYLPADLVAAANRVLGQALSIATAAQLPPGIVTVDNAIITRRVLDLAEAGQRVEYGDPLSRVLPDLLRDWQGGRVTNDGFDSLLRTSDAGSEWRSVLFGDMEDDSLSGTQRLLGRAADLAGLSQQFVVASAGLGQLRVDFSGTTNSATLDGSSQPYAFDYAGTNGEWAVTPYLTNAIFTWTFTNAPASADIAVLLVGTNGQAQQLRWQISNPPATAVYRFALSSANQLLQVDANGDGTTLGTIPPNSSQVNELTPSVVAVQQDLTVIAGRPSPACVGPDYGNYGTVVAVVFSKPMTQSTAGATNSYTVDGDNGANSVQIQPSGRIALLNLRKSVSAIIPRKLTLSGVADVRGNLVSSAPKLIQSFYPGTTNLFTGGVAVTGRVLKGDGTPAVGVPVTLTMYDGAAEPESCEPWVRRVSQVLTDSGGNFNFDFVMSGIPYSVSASDTSTLSAAALQLIMDSTITTQPDAQLLQQMISASSTPNSLLSLLSASTPAQAIVIVEGLDRALVNDSVAIGSGREGQSVPLILRFRGRATVTGQVVASDGVTPIPNAAVNLFPDPSSRELGRGVFTDGTGQFLFPGIPLGVFSVQVATSDKRGASVVGIIQTPGGSTNLFIPLPDVPVLYGELRGEIFDSDNITPVPNARVYLGQYNPGENAVTRIVSIVDADSSGSWDATNVPIKNLDVVAVTFDGSRVGVRTGIVPVAQQPTYVNVTLQAATTVFGRVQFDDGRPATNALVAGGIALVRTDGNGNFQLQGVPVGSVSISAGLERNPAAGINFPRLGSTSANIIAGSANYVVVKLRPAGRIFGKVFNSQGIVQPNIRVAIPQEGGFYYTDADANGNYVFENLALGPYIISAPANAVAPQLDTTQLGNQISSGDEDQILAAFKEAITVFVGSNDPLINGDGLNFHPSSWGYTSANITFDGADVNADVRFIPQGTITGTILNHQGVPLGAAVRLTGIGPDPTGLPVVTIRGDGKSDPATGKFGFTNVLLNGAWGLQAASPFYPVIIQTNGFTTEIDPDVSGIVLRFPQVNDVNGRIAGHVYYPDGTPVGQGAQVHISVSSDYQILTDTNGFFDTQTEFPALNASYAVEAFDPITGLKGHAYIGMTPGITNIVDVHLLSRNSTIQVVVQRADGTPAPGAQLEVDQGTYPNDAPIFGIADTNGMATFNGLWEGNYAVMAQYTQSSTKLSTRGGITVGANQTVTLTLHLGATGSVQGAFVKQDLVTPVYGANVAIGNLGFASTDTNGAFRFDGLPVGTYQLSSSDPVTGATASGSVNISFNGQVQTVQLVESTLGTVNGAVSDSSSSGFVAGANVTINFSDGVTPSRTVTTGPNGSFNFPGSPLGTFNLYALYNVPGTLNFTVSGQANGLLTSTATNVSVNIQLQPLTSLAVHVVRSDGVTPAQGTHVTLNNLQQDTSASGDVFFSNLTVPNNYGITAISQVGGDLFDGVQTNVSLTGRATNSLVTLVLPGVADVAGTVVASDGLTPVVNAEITIQFQSSLFAGEVVTALSDPFGHFTFSDVPLGTFLVTAASQSLAASETGTNTIPGTTNVVALRLGNSGMLIGTIVRADGVTPVNGVDVAIDFMSQSANAGRAVFHTAADGKFEFDNVPVGLIHVASAAPNFGGIINFTTALTSNKQVLDLGAVPFDEALPQVVQVTPANTTVAVPITNFVELLFSEALATNSIDATGIFIRSTNNSTVPATVLLEADTNGVKRMVRITPTAPLRSLQTYEVVVLSGDLPGPTGGIIGSGPRDLVGRAMAAPFESHFTTADNTPPNLLSIFPSNNAVQIDPSSVPRLTFDKTMNPNRYVFKLTGPNGPVSGAASFGINGQVLNFLPTVNLQANTTYSMVVSNLVDLAGNGAVGQPYSVSFATLDTIGPAIGKVDIVSNAPPVAGGTVQVEAVLVTNETGASVRFTQDFNPIGTATNLPYQVAVKLPTAGTTTVRAIATDKYGNDGQFVELTITVLPPQPPTIHFTLLAPTNSPITNGATVVVDITASGDTAISNLTALVGGAAMGNLISTNGADLVVQATVPATATPGQSVQIFAQAIDALGISSGQKSLSLPIADTAPPTLAIIAPTNNAHLPGTASFALTNVVADNSSNVTLSVSVTGSFGYFSTNFLTLVANVPLTNSFTIPLINAPTNGGSITATLTAVDAASNSTSVVRTFWLTNTPGPAISSLTIASNLPPLGGLTVPIQAVLAANIPNATVRFTQDSVSIGIATNAPYQVLVVLPASGSTIIKAIASDAFGNDGVATQLVITIQPNIQPTVQIVALSPPSGPLLSGSNFVINVIPSGNNGVFQLNATLSGAVTGTFSTLGTNLQIQGFVPATALAGQTVKISAQATDGLGQSSGPQTLTLAVNDGTAPGLTIISPAQYTQLTPSTSLPITLSVADNSAGVTLSVAISGALTNTQTIPIALTPNIAVTNVLNIPIPNEPTNGSPVQATITATDAAGNVTTSTEFFWLPGTQTTIFWDRQALGQIFPCTNGNTYTWPNNNNWNQATLFGDPCGTGVNVKIAPSNWSSTNYPNATNLDVVLGGLGGAPANLNVPVAIHSLTIQTNGGLTMANATSLSAVNYDFQGDGGITLSGSANLFLTGGIMDKSGGTNSFTITPGISLISSNGTFAVDSGTLVLPGNGSSYSSGAFNVSSNATLVLAPAGETVTMAGNFTGSGAGTVALVSATLDASAKGVSLSLPDGLLQLSAARISDSSIISNLGNITLAGANNSVLLRHSSLNNSGFLRHSSTGSIDIQQGAQIENLASGTYDLQTDGGFYSDDYSPWNFDNFGLLRKSGGTNVSTVSVNFNNQNGSVEVDSGTLALANSGTSSNANITVVGGATLDLTGGQNPTWAGQMNGTGAGRVVLGTGALHAVPSLGLNLTDGLFQWSGGVIYGVVTNLNVVSISSANTSVLGRQSVFNNVGLVRHIGPGRLDMQLSSYFENLAAGTYDLESDTGIYSDDYYPWNFDNYGTFRKSGGTNTSVVSILFNNQGGTIDVQTGTLSLANNGASSNAIVKVAAGALLDLTGGLSPTWAGTISGQGAGTMQLRSGTLIGSPSLTLDCNNGVFQWTGGGFAGTVTNKNITTLSAAGNVALTRSTIFNNAGLFQHTNTGSLDVQLNAVFVNLLSGSYDLQTDAGIYSDDYTPWDFENYGLFHKSGGTNTSTISINFNNHNGTIRVDTGTLSLANNGIVSNGTFNVAAGAVLNVTGGQSPTWQGQLTGSGSGKVLLNGGTLQAFPGVQLNFPDGLFQWNGGYFYGAVSNLNVTSISGSNTSALHRDTTFYNLGLVRHLGPGRLDFLLNSRLENLSGGIYDFESDTGIYTDDYSPQNFDNYGIVRKSSGIGTSSISQVLFNNKGGLLDVQTGTLVLANNGVSSNATVTVAAGAMLELTGGQNPTWSGKIHGTGAGSIALNSGTLTASGLILDCATNVFQWNGGGMNGTVTNTNVVTISGSNRVYLLRGAQFYNAGLVQHLGAGALDVQLNAQFENLASGIYDFKSDAAILSDDYGPWTFDNYGLIRKSAGTNTSAISVIFTNHNGSIEVDGGTLSIGANNFVQGTGAFTAQLGGTNAGQFGQFNANSLTLGGSLHVKLASGWAPSIGAHFAIMTGGSLSGTFSTVDVPAGITVSYSATGVTLVVTNTVTPSVQVPAVPMLSLQQNTRNNITLHWSDPGSNYVLETATTLDPRAVWLPFTNVALVPTNGALYFTIPTSNSAQFFRLHKR